MNKNIVLLHGWGSNTGKLMGIESVLTSLGWNTLNLKLPGFEEKNPERPWCLDDYCRYVVNKSDKYFQQKYFLFGHSFGGRIAILCAFKYHKNIRAVVLCSSGGISRANIFKRLFFGLCAKIGMVFLFIKPLAKFWKMLLYKIAGEHDYEQTEGVMRQTFKNIVADDLKNISRKIILPVLILWGDSDKITPIKDARFLKNAIKKSKLIIFKNQGHTLPYVSYEKIGKEIEKWSKNI